MEPAARLTPGWTVALVGVVLLAVLAAVPALSAGALAEGIHAAFSGVCHQIPERSPSFAGRPAALCHRCSGMLGGLLLGLALAPGLPAARQRAVAAGRQGRWLLWAVLPTAADWGLGASGLGVNTPASRVLTGLLFGAVAGVVLAVNLLTVSHSSPSTLRSHDA